MPTTTTTTTTKKPNDGPCAACEKEGAIFRCAPCRDAGVDVFFCDRKCQVKQWEAHKAVCKKTSNADSKKERSSANKETEAEGEEGLQLRNDIQFCANCLKTDNDIGSKLSVCSKCKESYYCSRECQVAHWPKHKIQCKHICEAVKNIERSFNSREKNIYHLLEKWVSKSRPTPFCLAVYHSFDEKEFEQQPPMKAVLVEVEFNYNAQAFVVAEEPRAVAIADLNRERKEMISKMMHEEKTIGGIDPGCTHHVIINSKELGERYVNTLAIVGDSLDKMKARANVDLHAIRFECTRIHLKSNLFRGWKSIRRNNLQKQMEQMNLGQSYTAFVQNALQFFCKNSLQKTHQLVVYMRMGKEIGQISQLLDYRVMPIAEFKQMKEEVIKTYFIHVEDIESRPHSCNEIAMKTLFLDSDTCFSFDFISYYEMNFTQNKTAKLCKKAADNNFRKLLQLVKETPSDLLEKVSL